MESGIGKKGIRSWLSRHPVLAVFAMLFFVLFAAVAVAMYINSTHASPPPQPPRRRPIIRGSSHAVPIEPITVVVEAGAVPMSRWASIILQAILVIVGVAVSFYIMQTFGSIT